MNSGNIVSAVFGSILKVVVTIMVVLVVYKGATTCYDYGYRIFTEPAMSTGEGRTVSVTITKDMPATEMAEMFYAKGLIRDENLFVLQYYLSAYRADLVAGEYEVSTAMTVEEMLESMVEAAEAKEESEESK